MQTSLLTQLLGDAGAWTNAIRSTTADAGLPHLIVKRHSPFTFFARSKAMFGTSWFFLAASMVMGQADVAAGQAETDVLQVANLAWLLGDWQGEYALPEGVSEVGPAGSKVVSTHMWRWTLNKKFIALRIHEKIEGRVASTGEEILGRDQGSGALAHWFFGSTGIHGAGTWSRNGDTWALKWHAVAHGGKKYEATSYHVQIDADSYTWQLKDITEDGNRIPDWPKVTYRRKKSAELGEDELWQAFRKAAEGTWNGRGVACRDYEPSGISEGDVIHLRMTLKSELDGRVMVGQSDLQLADKPQKLECRVLIGWDADARQVRLLSFWSGGLSEEFVISKQVGNAFIGIYTAKLPGSETQRARVRVKFITPDSFVVRFLDGPCKGKVLSSWKRHE